MFCKGSVDTPFTGVDTILQTQGKIMKNWSSSVDTSSVSTLVQVVSTLETAPRTFWVNLGQCVDTSSSSVDTRDLPRTLFGLFWDSVSTIDQVVSTLVPFQKKTYRMAISRKKASKIAQARTSNTNQARKH
ncbi:hypothetical protein Taro_015873 [Colocasia esculenta]|uniref:Uncharacterized protein n=1 Tax=Colocasia esculenta TaxID=4460 RepID=A0A843UNL6_COLES|nr:hypothetical protein [Colocasia esculenta]